MKDITYTLARSVVPGHHEVVVSYTDDNGVILTEFIFVNDKANVTDQYYIEEAKKEFIAKHKKRKFKFNKKTIIISLTSLALVAATATGITLGVILTHPKPRKEKDEFDKMKDYYINYIVDLTNIDDYKDLNASQIMNHVYLKTENGVRKYTKLKTQKIASVDTYYMDGIDYNFGSDRANWPASSHISQAKAIAVTAYVKNDPKILNIAVGMTYYWVYNNFHNTNWWNNELGAGANGLADLGLFTYDQLNSQGRAMLVSKVANASLYYRPSLSTHVGTNLFDYADITLRSSIFTKNIQEFNTAVNRVEQEITDNHHEGFQTDGAFFQHGQQVQIASYGKGGVVRLAKVLRAISSTGYKFKRKKMEIIERFLLRGLRDMTHKGYVNYSASGREYVRKDNLNANAKSSNFVGLKEYITLPDFERNNELKEYLDNLENHKSTFSGVEYFDRAHMIVANLDDLYISFKGTDSYLINSECVNEENRLGLNLSYGTNTCVMDEGNEYDNVSALWNYAYIPGTTSINLNTTDTEDFSKPKAIDETLKELKGDNYYKDDLFEGKLPVATDSNGYVYAGGEHPHPDNVPNPGPFPETVWWSMQRSTHHTENHFAIGCIATKYGVIIMGGDLSYDGQITSKEGAIFYNKPRSLHTTIEQCFVHTGKKGMPTLSDGNKTLTYGNAVYKILEGDNHQITMCNDILDTPITIDDAWNRNRKRGDQEEAQKEQGKVLLAYINHGPAIVGGEPQKYNYAYSIQPSSLAEDNTYHFEIANNFTRHAVQEAILYIGNNRKLDVILPYEDVDDYMPAGRVVGNPVDLVKGKIHVEELPA